MLKRISINRQKMLSNAKHGTRHSVIRVQTSKGVTYGDIVEINGFSRVVYSPDRPLKCGARVWIEATGPVRVDEEVLL